jgi:hypothetical protein
VEPAIYGHNEDISYQILPEDVQDTFDAEKTHLEELASALHRKLTRIDGNGK